MFVGIGIITGVLLGLILWGVTWILMRKHFVAFAEEVGSSIDRMILWKEYETEAGTERRKPDLEIKQRYEDTLVSKIQGKLECLSDITAAAAAENQEQKLAIQGIVSDISHQLKTPAANIVLYCDTLENEKLPPEKQRECIQILKKQADKLEFLIQSMMKMSRLESGMIQMNPEEVNLRDTLEDIIRAVHGKAEKKQIQIGLNCPEEHFLAYDEKWTTEALFNILDNAVKYTQNRGWIQIAVKRLDLYTKVVIEDNGCGIGKENINRVYERFFREEKNRSEEGVGLGLYLAREIIMMQKGYLKLESEEGDGTRVSVYLLNG